MSMLQLKGAFPPVITPFTEKGDLDLQAHQENISAWNTLGLAGYLLLGSNSEVAYLSESEKIELIKATMSVADKDKIIMAGTGLESTRETIRLTNKAAAVGAQCALLLTPSYYGAQMGDEAQIQYFTDVADHADIPILIYNVTKFTHINISAEAVAVLSKHPNIIGMKDSSGNIPQLAQFQRVIDPQEFHLMVGTASAWYPALDMGIQGAIMALANCLPAECVAIQKLYEENKKDEAKALHERVYPVNHAVTATYGVAGLKYACDLLGFRGGFVRRPLLDLKAEQKKDIEEILKTANVL